MQQNFYPYDVIFERVQPTISLTSWPLTSYNDHSSAFVHPWSVYFSYCYHKSSALL